MNETFDRNDEPLPTGSMSTRDERQWSMFIHLSQLAGYAVPLAGFIVPIILWQTKKDQSAMVDEHGRMVANAMITYFCYWVSAVILALLLIGIPLLIALAFASVAFPVIGGIKANDGVLWRYPLVFKFL